MLKDKIKLRHFYLLGLIGLMFCLPVSNYVLSIAQFYLGLIWLVNRNFVERLTRVRQNRAFWVVFSLFALHLLGLINTQDFEYALVDIRIKLPLLLIPFFVASEKPLRKEELKVLLAFFVLGLLVSTGISYYQFMQWTYSEQQNVREASVFISHIRLSLMLVLGIFICWYYAFLDRNKFFINLAFNSISIWFLYFLFQMQMLTGFAVLSSSILVAALWSLFHVKRAYVKWVGIASVLGILVFSLVFVYQTSRTFLEDPIAVERLDTTVDGHRYFHLEDKLQMENGYPVWINVCHYEMKEVWSERSEIDYDSTGFTGQAIHKSIVRYLASKGLSKDGAALKSLKDEEIEAIEQGATNWLFVGKNSLQKRVYETSWELHNYLVNRGNPSGNSVAQRLEFWNAAFYVVRHNWIIGVGTGDIKNEMNAAYAAINSSLDQRYWFKPHNQYLSILICFGVFGLFYFLGVFAWMFKNSSGSILSVVFLSIICISMLAEDTIETQIGVTFFASFASIFVVSRKTD